MVLLSVFFFIVSFYRLNPYQSGLKQYSFSWLPPQMFELLVNSKMQLFTSHISKNPDKKQLLRRILSESLKLVSRHHVGIKVPVKNFRSPSALNPNSFVTYLIFSSYVQLTLTLIRPFYKTATLNQFHDFFLSDPMPPTIQSLVRYSQHFHSQLYETLLLLSIPLSFLPAKFPFIFSDYCVLLTAFIYRDDLTSPFKEQGSHYYRERVKELTHELSSFPTITDQNQPSFSLSSLAGSFSLSFQSISILSYLHLFLFWGISFFTFYF